MKYSYIFYYVQEYIYLLKTEKTFPHIEHVVFSILILLGVVNIAVNIFISQLVNINMLPMLVFSLLMSQR